MNNSSESVAPEQDTDTKIDAGKNENSCARDTDLGQHSLSYRSRLDFGRCVVLILLCKIQAIQQSPAYKLLVICSEESSQTWNAYRASVMHKLHINCRCKKSSPKPISTPWRRSSRRLCRSWMNIAVSESVTES